MQQSENWNQKPTNFKFYWFSNEVVAILSIEKIKAKTCVGRRCRLCFFFQPHTNQQPHTTTQSTNHSTNQIRLSYYDSSSTQCSWTLSRPVSSQSAPVPQLLLFSHQIRNLLTGAPREDNQNTRLHISPITLFMSIWQTRQETYQFHLIWKP